MKDSVWGRAGMTAADPGTDPLLSPPLDGEQLALLRRYGQERATSAGEVLFREGDRAYDFIVVLSGGCRCGRPRGWGGAGAGHFGPGPVRGRAGHLDRRAGVRDRGGQGTRVGTGGSGGSVAGGDRAGSATV